MEEIKITLSLYFKISDSMVYGGPGSTGYAKITVDNNISEISNDYIRQYAESQRRNVARMCEVGPENVKIISRSEYDENTDDE